VIEGHPSIKQRPVLKCLGFVQDLGGSIEDISDDEKVRLQITGGYHFAGSTVVDTAQTSQFLTALLLVAPLANNGIVLKTTSQKLVGEGYIDLTIEMMAERGVIVGKTTDGYKIVGGHYKNLDTEIPSDFTALSYMLAAVVAVPNSKLTVPNYRPSSMTSEREFFEAFAMLGAKAEFDESSRELRIWHDEPISKTINIDGINIPTVTPALCSAACYANADVTLHGAAHVT